MREHIQGPRLGLAIVASASVLFAQRGAADDAASGVRLLDVGERSQGASAGTTESSPWQRLPADVRTDLSRVLAEQLRQPARSDLHKDRSVTIAASDEPDYAHTAKAYKDFRGAGLSDAQWPRFFFDSGLDEEGRRVLVTLYAKLKAEGLWDRLQTFDRFDPWNAVRAGFWAMPLDGAEDFQGRLVQLGYGGDLVPSRGDRWAVRSKNTGAQFHIIGPPDGRDPRFVEMHIDWENPGTLKGTMEKSKPFSLFIPPAAVLAHGVDWARHGLSTDEWVGNSLGLSQENRERMADRLREAIVAERITVPDVDQDTYGSTVLSDTLRWRTSTPYFGVLTLYPRQRWAGWRGGRGDDEEFQRVQLIDPAGATDDPVRFRLTFSKGIVEIFIAPGGHLSGQWFRTDVAGEAPLAFDGDLVFGHAERAAH